MNSNLRFSDLVFALIVLVWALLLSSCNNAKHMQKVYPLGFYDAGGYKANHTKPRSDSVVVKSYPQKNLSKWRRLPQRLPHVND